MGFTQISLLIGSSYGDGEHDSPYGHTAVVFTEIKMYQSLSMTLADMGKTYSEELGLGNHFEWRGAAREAEGIFKIMVELF